MTMTNAQYQEIQDQLNAVYDQALARARANGTDGTLDRPNCCTPEEWRAEIERARIADLKFIRMIMFDF